MLEIGNDFLPVCHCEEPERRAGDEAIWTSCFWKYREHNQIVEVVRILHVDSLAGY